ncbi:MAG TPA: sugar phosphate isomerase/epimerase family protein [Limnochordia bacterium]
MRIGSSTYSFRRLGYAASEEENVTLRAMFERAAALGLAGLELLAVQFESEERAYLHELKRLAAAHALDLYALSLHHNFVTPDAEKRREQVAYVKRWLDAAAVLGTPLVRVFGGRWGTVKGFRELMEREGHEDPLPGYRYEDALEWNAACFSECAAHAAQHGIVLALENHWGLTHTAKNVLDILQAVDSEWLKVALDCGNFRVDTYAQLEALAPHAVIVHAKTYFGGGIFYNLDLDYRRILAMLRRHGYQGYLSIEFEGRDAPSAGLPASIALLQEALAATAGESGSSHPA